MLNLWGIPICLICWTLSAFYLGVTITASIIFTHVALVPYLFKYSKSFRRSLVFANFIQWPFNVNYEDPSSYGVDGGRNFTLEYHSKVDGCRIKLGVWHILPKSLLNRYKGSFEKSAENVELNTKLDEELATSRTPIMLYCHGNSNSRGASHRVKLYKFFQQMDFHTIAFDYRGYADSTNLAPSEDGVVEDSLVVYEWLQNTLNKTPWSKDVPPIFVWGHSLGTGISSHLLGNLATLSTQVLDRDSPLPLPKGLILEAPFSNLADEVLYHPLSMLIKWLPYYESCCVTPFVNDKALAFRSDEHLVKVPELPILILHAKDDVIVPFVVGLKLYRVISAARGSNGATCKLHAYDTRLQLGHKNIYQAEDLSDVIGNFVSSHNTSEFYS